MANINPSAPFVENQLPGRSNHNLSCCRSTSAAMGVPIPIYVKEVLPSDKIRIKPIIRIRTNPLVSGLLSSFTVRVAWFYESDANLYGYLDNDDAVTSQQLQNMKLHTLPFAPAVESNIVPGQFVSGVGSGCLANYLYAPKGFQPRFTNAAASATTNSNAFDLGRWLGYWDIYRNFYVNRQISHFPMFSTALGDEVIDTQYSPSFSTVKVDVLDKLLRFVRMFDDGTPLPTIMTQFINKYPSLKDDINKLVFNSFSAIGTTQKPGVPASLDNGFLAPLSGLPLCNLRADVFTRMMSAASSTGTVTFNSNVGSLVTASRLFAFVNNIDITGGRVSDWMRFRWGVDIKRASDRPICLSVDTFTMNVDDLRTTAQSGSQAAATQVGYIDLGDRLSKVSFNNKTGFGGNLYCILHILPNVYYSQGIEQEVMATKFMDKYNPEFANENFVQIPRFCLAALPNKNSEGKPSFMGNSFTQGYGRTTSWWYYQTDVNRSYGDLSALGSKSSWTLNQDYFLRQEFVENPVSDKSQYFDPSTYCYPHRFNYAFAEQSPTSQNFIIQFGIDVNANRLMPSYSQPEIK